MRIIFLDMDGVVCTPRVAISSGDRGLIRRLDPVVIGMLNKFHEHIPGLLFVASSSWRWHDDMPVILQAAGFNGKWHEEWRTPQKMTSGRGTEIGMWLDAHGFTDKKVMTPDDYVVIDDDVWDMGELRPRCVQTSTYDGMLFKHFMKVFKLFGVPVP